MILSLIQRSKIEGKNAIEGETQTREPRKPPRIHLAISHWFLKVTFVTWPVTSPTPEKRKRPHRPKHAQDSRNPPPQEKSVETCSVEGRKPRRPLTGSSLFLSSQKWNNLGVKLKVRAGNEPGRHGVDADVGSNGTGRAYAYGDQHHLNSGIFQQKRPRLVHPLEHLI
ncbi:hypothetical protein B0H14DRAFT_2561843 [Mycena olivaceomarginata]|nr:hypothetical protein B0H14DRAFT_2561843 [Mycena olivaceomarginata]